MKQCSTPRLALFTVFVLACGASPAGGQVHASANPVRGPRLAQAAGTGTDATPPARRRRFSLTERFLDWTGLSSSLPHSSSGGFSLLQIAGYRLEINPSLHDPLTAVGACADLVTSCYSPPSSSLDQCVATAQSCSTAEPWLEHACCPTACQAGYARARQAGAQPLAAFERVFFEQPDCFPGVRAMITRPR